MIEDKRKSGRSEWFSTTDLLDSNQEFTAAL
jgi:hypothetical protein